MQQQTVVSSHHKIAREINSSAKACIASFKTGPDGAHSAQINPSTATPFC
ncbi:MAG: hypothetical protein VCE75_28920 [Alphaproteobacteria bacterium]